MQSVYIPKIKNNDTTESLEILLNPLFQVPISRVDLVLQKNKHYKSAYIHFVRPLSNELTELIYKRKLNIKDNNYHVYLFYENFTIIPEYPPLNNSQIGENLKRLGDLIIELDKRITNIETIIKNL